MADADVSCTWCTRITANNYSKMDGGKCLKSKSEHAREHSETNRQIYL